ncbi:MAG: hypothetical protein HQL23_03695 [Candidatus Omnitrophica bacterium]|nr:hypothetical protein [Candidatus Omnitrophota bacterium]
MQKRITFSRVMRTMILFLFTAVFYSGCTFIKYTDIEPVTPKIGSVSADTESLQPILRWNDRKVNKGSHYDVGIWETLVTASGIFRDNRIYYRENISGPEHRVEIKLEPNHTYYWSVRVSGSANWASSDILSVGAGSTREHDVYFIFTTPKQ